MCVEYKGKIANDKVMIEMYSNMLGDYDADMLSDERKAELKALVDKWQEEDETE